MSVDVLNCPSCRVDLLRSDAEGLFHNEPPPACPRCGMLNPLREAVFEFVSFGPAPWPPEGIVFADRNDFRS